MALYSSLSTLFAQTVSAGLAAGLPPQQVQAATSVNALAPSIVPTLVNNVVATTPAGPVPTPTPTPTPTPAVPSTTWILQPTRQQEERLATESF